jgi:hypothetical protein
MATANAIRAAAAVVMLVSGAFLVLSWRGPGPDFNPKPHQALGRAVAEEALKLVRADGRIMVFARDPKSFKAPAQAEQWLSFCQTVNQAGRKIASTNLLQVDPLRTPGVPPGTFAERLQRATAADVVVSFLGLPDFTDDQIKRLGEKRPSVVAVCTGTAPLRVNLRRLFEQRLLHTAIVSRTNPQPKPPDTAPLRSWFDSLFQVVTAANAADLPVPAPATP